MSVGESGYLSRLQTLLVFSKLGMAQQNKVGNIGILVEMPRKNIKKSRSLLKIIQEEHLILTDQ